MRLRSGNRQGIRRDLEFVARSGLDLAERQGGGSEEMDMNVAGLPELAISEMMMCEVRDAVRHRFLAAQKGPLPQDFAAAPDARRPPNGLRQFSQQQFGTDHRSAQLRMFQPEIVAALRDVIGEFVGQREAQPAGSAVGIDEMDTGDLRLLAVTERDAG